MSAECYTRLERGNLAGVSNSALDRIATALRLDPAESDHLYSLADATDPTPMNSSACSVPRLVRDTADLLKLVVENKRRVSVAAGAVDAEQGHAGVDSFEQERGPT